VEQRRADGFQGRVGEGQTLRVGLHQSARVAGGAAREPQLVRRQLEANSPPADLEPEPAPRRAWSTGVPRRTNEPSCRA
jgi:hypothetical protein